MPSNINPNNINGSYPTAGQDNDSQGFRDNFTNIRTNLAFAKDEITDLQNKVVLKAPLGSTSGTVTNDMSNTILSRAETIGFTETAYALTPVVGVNTLEFTNGDIQYMTMPAGNITLAFSGWPTATYATMQVWIKVLNTSDTITFPAAVSAGADKLLGTAPGALGTTILTPVDIGDYLLEFGTIDGGTTVFVSQLVGPGADVAGVTVLVNGILNEIITINGNVAALSSNVGNVEANVTTLQGNIVTLTSDFGNVSANVTTLQGNVAFTSEDVADAAAISLTTTCSYFTTAGPETATLAAGTYGQRKILSAVDVTAGSMVVTITNPGWGGAGTITFATNGQSCELTYHNSKWFCVGNNGAAFA